jgi:hypothetical protein
MKRSLIGVVRPKISTRTLSSVFDWMMPSIFPVKLANAPDLILTASPSLKTRRRLVPRV